MSTVITNADIAVFRDAIIGRRREARTEFPDAPSAFRQAGRRRL